MMTKILSIAVFLGASLLSFSQVDSSKISTTQKFDEVLTYINQLYVDDVDAEALADAAIVAMLEKLDPHSTFISKDEVSDANQQINGNFVGIGIRFQILRDTLMVVATIPGGPSAKLGLKPGDKIISIADENVAGIGLKNSGVKNRLLGDRGTKVMVEVKRRKEKDPISFVITRDLIPLNSVDASYMVTPTTLRTLKAEGMENLIFDLQGNGGGLLYAAKYLADEFLSDNKLIVYSEGRSQPRLDLRAGKKGLWEEGRLVMLTNEYSASASEILSGAIQDWDRGLIVGRRTYGKPIDLTDGSQIRLTIARYFTPSGRFIQKSYEDLDAYRNDLTNRYENGEFMSLDSIQLPDSLKFKTDGGRIVYGGGGIMPDQFVPLDTSETSDYYSDLNRAGLFNQYSLTYVDDNRDNLLEKYPDFAAFNAKFDVDDKFLKKFLKFAEKEDEELEFNEEEYNTSLGLIKIRIKAMLAQDLWGYSEFYQVYNGTNEILQDAIKLIESDNYTKALESNLQSNN
jgi:carboxyl-terminal processing protease